VQEAQRSATSDPITAAYESSSQAQDIDEWEPMQPSVSGMPVHQPGQSSWHEGILQSTSLAHRLEPHMGVDDSRLPSPQPTALAGQSWQLAQRLHHPPLDLLPEGDPLSMIRLSDLEARYLVDM
jgi:hypothetical protein